MEPKMRPLHKKLDLATYERGKFVTFKLTGELIPSDKGVAVPFPIMFRYYHIGRAYDLHQLKNLSPLHCFALDLISMQLLASELEAVRRLINDPVLTHFSDKLVAYIKSLGVDAKSRMILSAVV